MTAMIYSSQKFMYDELPDRPYVRERLSGITFRSSAIIYNIRVVATVRTQYNCAAIRSEWNYRERQKCQVPVSQVISYARVQGNERIARTFLDSMINPSPFN